MEDMGKWIEAEMQKIVDDPVTICELKRCREYCTGFKARKAKLAERAKKFQAIMAVMTRVGLNSLDYSKKNCPLCFRRYGDSFGELDAECPVELPCGYMIGN
jgi:hypothetical protein